MSDDVDPGGVLIALVLVGVSGFLLGLAVAVVL